jgi:hypothetical protein
MPVSNRARHRRFIGVGLALACAGLVLLVIALTTRTPGPSAGSCSLAQVTSGSQPACWKPFVASSPFNTRLSSSPRLSPNSSAVVHQMVARGWLIDGSGSTFDFSPKWYGTRPLFFATPSDPVMTIACKNPASFCTGANGVDIVGTKIHVPVGAVPYANSDAHMTVIEKATGAEYDFWDTSISGSTISAQTAAVVNVKAGNGLGSQGDAALFALSAGLVRPAELASGKIDHALVVTVPCTDGNGKAGYTYPARGGYGSPCGPNGSAADRDVPGLGQLLRLNMTDAQIRSSSAPAWQKTIMTAFAHYGAYVEDTGDLASGIDILAQAPSSWTDLGQRNQWAPAIARFGSSGDELISNVPIRVGDLQVVSPCVPQHSCSGA